MTVKKREPLKLLQAKLSRDNELKPWTLKTRQPINYGVVYNGFDSKWYAYGVSFAELCANCIGSKYCEIRIVGNRKCPRK